MPFIKYIQSKSGPAGHHASSQSGTMELWVLRINYDIRYNNAISKKEIRHLRKKLSLKTIRLQKEMFTGYGSGCLWPFMSELVFEQ